MGTNYWGDDAWDTQRGRGRSPYGPPVDGFLNVGGGAAGLYRSRSVGQGQAPQINVYNRIENDQDHYPPYPPTRASPRASPSRSRYGGHHHQRLGDDLIDDLAELELERRARSRSRGRTDVSSFDRDAAYNEWKLAQAQEQLRDAERRRDRERSEQRIRDELRYKYEREEDDKRREKQRLEDDLKSRMQAEELKRQRDREASEQREKLWAEEFKRKEREKKDKAQAEEQRIKDDIARKKKEEKEEEERMFREFEDRKRKEKEKEEERLKEAERILKEREEKKKREEREAEEKFQDEMRHRLRDLGYTEKTIEIMVDKEKAKKFKTEVEVKSDSLNIWRPAKAPVYPKVHRDYLAVETLKYYDLPWEYDPANKDYIIILRDMSKAETDILFEHTTRLRSGSLLIESSHKKKQPEYAWIRKRSKSRHGKDRVGIIEFK